MKLMNIFTALVAVSFVAVSAEMSEAKDKGNKPKGNKVKVEGKPGKGSKTVPPGQIKRYTRGAKLPADLKYTDIGDLSKWKLKAPGKGNRYVQVGDEILEVTDDMSTVVDAVGIVGDLLK
ncbi:hypothetical protein TRL7639_01749 [Falsiruegeria litorea R37]|uniref:Nickel/cobalt homeostasis protein RcnB n=1 Tax=Falsiruegeria litorea R37 TaxID=1200284 RepID=A0A1Y5SB05_9RHOB|nr:hypothetical protein [Falsiruegeria litorea]SLN36289.1 hypothetical protein TRL7639_01749 [Falsiruegeria litorea R37]